MFDDDITVLSDPSIPNTLPEPLNLGVFTTNNSMFLPVYVRMMLNPSYIKGRWSRNFQARNIIKTMKHLDNLGDALKGK